MIIIKDNYYLYIENLEDLDFKTLKSNRKINIIYRNIKKFNIFKTLRFRNKCKIKKFKFFIANDYNKAKMTKADGIYISSYNKKRYYSNILKIGSAHSLKEINEKVKQRCKNIIVSRLFKTNYKNKTSFLGVLKFNLLCLKTKQKIIPLGGINENNLLKLNLVKSNGFAILSAVKKKPTISSRLF